MLSDYTKDGMKMAVLADGRAAFYAMLVNVFGCLPDNDLIKRMKGTDILDFLNKWYDIGVREFQPGIDHIRSYQRYMKSISNDEALAEISVDRTRIMRTSCDMQAELPYEGVYREEKNQGESLLALNAMYRKAGILPAESVWESPDYLCIELDFMKHLCRREKKQWSSNGNAVETITIENEFLNDHLGKWVKSFCSKIKKYATTEFYMGFLLVMDVFVDMDQKYIKDLARITK